MTQTKFIGGLYHCLNNLLGALGRRIGVDELHIHGEASLGGHLRAGLLDGLQKVANRITLGLVVAALIVGAALLMRIETSFRIFGYPGLAMIFFLLAAAAGLVLVLSILFYDEKPDPKKD